MTCRTRISNAERRLGDADRQLGSPLRYVQGDHRGDHSERVTREVYQQHGAFVVSTTDGDLSPEERDVVIRIGRRRYGARP